MANSNDKDEKDEFLGMMPVDEYSLTKYMQRDADNNLVSTNQVKSPDQLLADISNAVQLKYKLNRDNFDEMGMMLLKNRGNMARTAAYFKMDVTEFRSLVRMEPILNAYWRACYHEIKGLVDDVVIEKLMANHPDDKDIVKEVFKKMYSGRKQGGYNINELGAIGYKDPLAIEQHEEIKAETQDDIKQTFNVIIEFADKAVPLNSEESVEGQLLESIDVTQLDEDVIEGDETN